MRITKHIGYALVDISYEGNKMTDPRINRDRLRELAQHPFSEYLNEYASYLAKRLEISTQDSLCVEMELAALRRYNESGRVTRRYPFIWKEGNGYPKIFMVQPLAAERWSRYDDPIDNVEHNNFGLSFNSDMNPEFREINTGIYPYLGLYMDSRTGRQLSTLHTGSWQTLMNLSKDEIRNSENEKAIGRLSKAMGFNNREEASQYITTFVPEEVRLLLGWSGVFTTSETWTQLRTGMYTCLS